MQEATRPAEAPAPHTAVFDAGAISMAVRQLHLSFRLYERHLAALMQLKPLEYQAMEHILEGRGALGPLELSSRLGLAAGTTTEMLDRLQQLGHVVRGRDEKDGRRVKLAPTASSLTRVLSALAPAMGDLGRVADGFERSEQEVILRFLREASDAIMAHTVSSEQPRRR